MFGVLSPTDAAWSCQLRKEWAGHFCGTCLALGDCFGQPARLATNYDAVLISALTDAQRDEPTERRVHRCPLRGFRRLAVMPASDEGARYAASLSMLMVATRVDDAVADGDGLLGRLPNLSASAARHLRAKAAPIARALGFDCSGIEAATSEQAEREAQSGRGFDFYSEPTERAAAIAFAHTAEITCRYENRAPLAEIGGLFGRIMFLLDSFKDLRTDRRQGTFNALAATCEEGHEQAAAQRLFREAFGRIRELLDQCRLVRPQLVHELLVGHLSAVGGAALGLAMETVDGEEAKRRKKSKDCFDPCCCDSGCCDCCGAFTRGCDCGCDCDCCGG